LVNPRFSRQAAAAISDNVASRAVDMISLEGSYLWHMMPDFYSVPIIVMEQNVESEILRQMRVLANGQADQEIAEFESREREAWRKASRVVTVTEEEEEEEEEDRNHIARIQPEARISVGPMAGTISQEIILRSPVKFRMGATFYSWLTLHIVRTLMDLDGY
jgi:hypothetical protein